MLTVHAHNATETELLEFLKAMGTFE
jgi:hypothetical protein